VNGKRWIKRRRRFFGEGKEKVSDDCVVSHGCCDPVIIVHDEREREREEKGIERESVLINLVN